MFSVCPPTRGYIPQSQVLSKVSGPRSILGGTPVLVGGIPVPARMYPSPGWGYPGYASGGAVRFPAGGLSCFKTKIPYSFSALYQCLYIGYGQFIRLFHRFRFHSTFSRHFIITKIIIELQAELLLEKEHCFSTEIFETI